MKKISTLLKKISNKLSKVFYFDTYSPTGYGFSSNQYRRLTRQLSARSGYTPIVIQVTCSTHAAIRVFNWYIDGNTIAYEALNTSSSAITDVSFTITMLWLKNELGGGSQ